MKQDREYLLLQDGKYLRLTYKRLLSADRTLSINRKLSRSTLPGQELKVSSIYITRTLRLNKESAIEQICSQIRESSRFEYNQRLRKLHSTIKKSGSDFDVKISFKNLIDHPPHSGKDSGNLTNRIRIRVETEDVTYKSLKSSFEYIFGLINNIADNISKVWDDLGTYSLTISFKKSITTGRELQRTAKDHPLELFGNNVRIRNINQDDVIGEIELLNMIVD